MSDTHKEGKRPGRKIKHRPQGEGNKAVFGRHCYGRTEKILRRCRKIWTRLLNKIRRRQDKQAILEG